MIGWPADGIDPNAYWSLATLVNMAQARGLQVGISLNTHCVVSNAYAVTGGLIDSHIGARRTLTHTEAGGWRGCSDQSMEDSKRWYQAVIQNVEKIIQQTGGSKEAIAFWELSGNPENGASEIPMWDNNPWLYDRFNSATKKTYPGIATFVKNVWPYFKNLTTRPTAVTVLPIASAVNSSPTDISALTNFQYWTQWALPKTQPDYYIFTSSPALPLTTILQHAPASKIILGDLKWQQSPVDTIYNPQRLNATQVLNDQFQKFVIILCWMVDLGFS